MIRISSWHPAVVSTWDVGRVISVVSLMFDWHLFNKQNICNFDVRRRIHLWNRFSQLYHFGWALSWFGQTKLNESLRQSQFDKPNYTWIHSSRRSDVDAGPKLTSFRRQVFICDVDVLNMPSCRVNHFDNYVLGIPWFFVLDLKIVFAS